MENYGFMEQLNAIDDALGTLKETVKKISANATGAEIADDKKAKLDSVYSGVKSSADTLREIADALPDYMDMIISKYAK